MKLCDYNLKKFYDKQSNPSYLEFSKNFGIGIDCKSRNELFSHLELKDLDILEIGIGTGANFKFYNSSNIKSLTAIDISINMLNLAKQNLRYFPQIKDKIEFLLDDGSKFNKNLSEKFDLIIMTYNLSSPKENDKILSNIIKYLKKNGIIAIADSHHLFAKNNNSILNTIKNSININSNKLNTWSNIYKVKEELKLIRNKSFYENTKKTESIIIFKKL